MPDAITWDPPFCQDSGNCFRLGTDLDGHAYIAVNGQEEHALRDSTATLRALVHAIKAGRADHLL
jgi:hypothetical protein